MIIQGARGENMKFRHFAQLRKKIHFRVNHVPKSVNTQVANTQQQQKTHSSRSEK